jgi:RecB family exonuclease
MNHDTQSSEASLFSQIPIHKVVGLNPSVWLCAGAGFSREEIKAVIFNSGEKPGLARGLIAEAITTGEEIARKIVEATGSGPLQLLSPHARQEGLRLLFSESRISAHLPELKRLKRQGSFFRRLDQALQSGRMAFSHSEEESVIEERLLQRFGANPVREEVRLLCGPYEAWLSAMGFWDPPLLFRKAIEVLVSGGWPEKLSVPEEIFIFSVQEPESLERGFWEAVGRHTGVRRLGASNLGTFSPDLSWEWELWHTQDDASQRLADRISTNSEQMNWNDHAVLMADLPAVRRSLKRALKDAGIPEADPRDPNRLRIDESVKWALLPLEVVANDFERSAVHSWLRTFGASLCGVDLTRVFEEIASRGVRQGLKSYAGGGLVALHQELKNLAQDLGGKKNCAEFAEAHLKVLKKNLDVLAERALGEGRLGASAAAFAELSWLSPFFESFWKQFCEDWKLLGLSEQRAPILYWLDKLQARLEQTPAPVERLRPREGLRIYRLQQAPLIPAKTVWIVGVSSSWLSAQGTGDYWFGQREREVLSSEFAVRSGIQVREERLASLKAWLGSAEKVIFLDSQYSPDGRERESILPVFQELKSCGGVPPEEPVEMGAHPRWVASFGALRPLQPQQVRLSGLARSSSGAVPEFSATTMERYSKCSFQSLAMDRWRLRDAREPDCELWADSRGNILHEAVKILLKNVRGDSESLIFGVSPKEALDQAWELKPPRGLLRSKPMEVYLRSRMLQVLESFCEKEREYRKRSGARTVSLDEAKLRMEFQEFCVTGTPDRIDETSDGLFVMDYKTSSALPNGTEMIEAGYRLQLPFYALAASKGAGKPVLGVQFIELNRKASRSSGIFFKKFNGKEPGKLTAVTTRSKSLVPFEPEEAWSRLEDHLLTHGLGYVRGEFSAKPKKPDKECSSCVIGDLCGYRRRVSDGLIEGSEGENGG